jgi:hypothetical protein
LHMNVKNVIGEEVTPGVIERVLLSSVEGELGGPEVRHYTLSEGGRVEFRSPLTEADQRLPVQEGGEGGRQAE